MRYVLTFHIRLVFLGLLAAAAAAQPRPTAYWEQEPQTQALIEGGERSVAQLTALLQQPPRRSADPERLRAAYVLRQLRYSGIVELLEREIAREPDGAARIVYETYLAREDMPRGTAALVAELKRGDMPSENVVAAFRAVPNLRQIRDRGLALLAPLLSDSRPEVRLGAAEISISLGDQRAEQVLLQLLGTGLELRAAMALPERYGDRLAPVLEQLLRDADAGVRLKAAQKLAFLGNPAGFDILVEALRKELDPERRGGTENLSRSSGPAGGLIQLIGNPDTYDPLGTPAQREGVLQRWERRWRSEGRNFLHGFDARGPAPGLQEAWLGDISLSATMPDMRAFYFLPGRRMFELGAMDGTYPPLGRLLGDQSGIWAHPAKVMDRFEYVILEPYQQPWALTDSRHFINEFHACKFLFARNGLRIERQDFVVEDEPALVSRLTIRNLTDHERHLEVQLTGWVNIRPSWRSGLPNGPDILEYRDGAVAAHDEAQPDWAVVFGADRLPRVGRVEDNKGVLVYPLIIPAGQSVALTVVISADNQAGVRAAQSRFQTVAAHSGELLTRKAASYRDQILGGVAFECPDKSVRDAFYLAKANLLMLTADLRPYFPAPYFFAGIPYYTQLFSNDSFYTIPGATAAGFRETSRGALEDLALHTEKQAGIVPHEICTNGKFIGAGNRQETPQFVMASWRYFEWTGDRAFLERIYPLAKDSINAALKRFDRNGNGYLEGPGLIEVAGMGSEKVDAAAYLYAAYEALAGMALVLGQTDDAGQYAGRAATFRRKFNSEWWDPGARLWADSLNADGSRRLDGYWSVVFPMETGLADHDKAIAALEGIENGWVNQWGGVHTRQPDITAQGAGVITTNIFAWTAFRYGLTAFGWKLLHDAALAPAERGMLGAFAETIPLGGSDLIQMWSSGPFLGAVIEGLAGIRPHADRHTVEIAPRLPQELPAFTLRGIAVGEHLIDLECTRRDGALAVTVSHRSGPAALRVELPNSATRTLASGETARITVN
jgi:glycogen debranching enzyme/HEAT repeat protein